VIDVASEKVEEIAEAPSAYGGAWGRDGTILFSPDERTPIHRVSAKGGAVSAVTTLDATRGDEAHRWPQFLPDGRHFVFLPWKLGSVPRVIQLASLDGGSTRTLCESESAALVRLDNVGACYRIAVDRGLSLKEVIVRGRRRRIAEHHALRGIDLEIRRGETIGIIGGNGAGKTTLLRLIARVLYPTAGRIRVRGTVAPLIDLFGMLHHELTGRENAYLTGALLGVRRRDMQRKIDAIADFAGIGEFFDAPLRTYSTGMMVRLAFATTTSVDADILLIDEALAVGDAAFQRKSGARIEEFRRAGVTGVVVSHDVRHLAGICDRILWLEGGRIVEVGQGRQVVERYLASSAG
jgi:ABC-type polysaccharide/polyol phosphate transport system ATPase subunit